ncbi:hypothetical protein HMPREF9123_0576 [Neisseria bacilliformis ATCC BAA-1200]|uniref:Uncharacterized protein n=1 Tax=Neisseria bacilliformis ATCC BAA-1200 TaxID=888742 RepID=F2B9X7_9NEIS|nr:hypothetical protein HMPREF9123_0576 [Neisseria bacilliformis ATCC BAA-1200]
MVFAVRGFRNRVRGCATRLHGGRLKNVKTLFGFAETAFSDGLCVCGA